MQAISHLPSLSIPSSAEAASSIIGGSFYIQLYSVLQTNILQREQILHAMKQLIGSDLASPLCLPSISRLASPSSALSVDRSMLEAAHEKEKELLNEVLELQWRLLCSQDEVQRLKAKAAQIWCMKVVAWRCCSLNLSCTGMVENALSQWQEGFVVMEF